MLFKKPLEVTRKTKKSIDQIPQLQHDLENFQIIPRDVPAAISELSWLHAKNIDANLTESKQTKNEPDLKLLSKIVNYGHLDAADMASVESCTEKVKTALNDYKKFTDDKNAYISRVKEFLMNLRKALNQQAFLENKYHVVDETKHRYGLIRKQVAYRNHSPILYRKELHWGFYDHYGHALKKEWIKSTPSPVKKLDKMMDDMKEKQVTAQPDQFYLDTFVRIVDIMNHAYANSKKPVHKTTADFYDKVLADINLLSFYPQQSQQQMRLN